MADADADETVELLALRETTPLLLEDVANSQLIRLAALDYSPPAM